MAAGSSNASSRAKRPLRPYAETWLGRVRLERWFCALAVVFFLLGGAPVLQGADAYSAALDKRFAAEPDSEPHNANVAALEKGIVEQAREMSQKQGAPPPETPKSVGPLVALVVFVPGGLVAGLVAVLGLRRWNRWLDRRDLKASENVMAEDPLMREFLRTLRESVGPEGSLSAATTASPALPRIDPVAEKVAALRTDFPRLRRAADEAGRLRILRELIAQVESIKQGSDSAQLRSVRLLASGLQGLLNQFSLKAANITPSALRTAASGMDLLELLCNRTSRPDLATNPPVRLLAVDDEPLSRRAVSVALKKVFNEPDLAQDGQSAVALARQHPYDLILLDVEMPGLDGFEVCSKIHETAANCTTPVVFVTSHSDFDSRAKSALAGAHDLIGKPFLAFEIAVKALTLVLKARLEGPNKVAGPDQASESVAVPAAVAVAAPSPVRDQPAVSSKEVTSASANEVKTAPKSRPEPAKSEPSPVAVSSKTHERPRAELLELPQPSSREFAHAFFKGAPAHLQLLQKKLAAAREAAQPAERNELLSELFIGVHSIGSEAARAQLGAALRVASALEALFKKLVDRPASCTPSTLQTAGAALETLEQLCGAEEDLDLSKPPARLLVVDDDPVARRAIGGALQLAIGRPDSADCGEAALALAEEKPYDLIFLDVIMPGMDGFAVCARVHELALNRRTPVVFVTSQDDTNSRAEATASGGCGFIPKPVLPCELTLLALTHIVRARLQPHSAEPWQEANAVQACEGVLAG